MINNDFRERLFTMAQTFLFDFWVVATSHHRQKKHFSSKMVISSIDLMLNCG